MKIRIEYKKFVRGVLPTLSGTFSYIQVLGKLKDVYPHMEFEAPQVTGALIALHREKEIVEVRAEKGKPNVYCGKEAAANYSSSARQKDMDAIAKRRSERLLLALKRQAQSLNIDLP